MGDTEPFFHATRLTIAPTVFIAPGAVLVGDVTVGDKSSVWYQCVLRGDIAPVVVGERTNIQDGTIVHVDVNQAAVIGNDVSIAHGAVIHGCTIEDGCLVGMGAVVLSGARVGAGALVAAGTVVREGFVVPAGAVCAGVPGRIRGEVDEALRRRMAYGRDNYIAAAAGYLAGRLGGGPHGGR